MNRVRKLLIAGWMTVMVALPVAAFVASACTPAHRDAVKTAFDVAAEACRFAYGQRKHELPFGLTVEQFCGEVANVRPFVDSILEAQRMQAERLRTRAPSTDAGVD